MATSDEPAERALLTPTSLAEALPSRPLLSSPSEGWGEVILQRYRHPPSTIDVPGLRDHLLVGHLVGPVLVEEGGDAGHPQRRWTGPGQISFTPAGQPLHRVLKGRPDVVLLHLPPALLHAVAEEMFDRDGTKVRLGGRLAASDETGDRLVRLLLAEAEAPALATRVMTDTLTHALAVHLLRHYSNLSPQTPESGTNISGPRLRRVLDHMRAHADEALPLAQLATVAGLSSSRFAAAFRAATGQPPHRYLVGLRIGTARDLLENTDLPVTEIGVRCGFEQPSHFATAFRKVVGLSPRAWRLARRF